jgi:hypothetical protein
MVRAWIAIDRLFAEGYIDTSSRSLLVVGGGVAGATAAVFAAASGIRTILVERATGCFLRQSRCTSRWIDPAQYDWPLSHWHRSRFPFARSQMWMPFSFPAGMADAIALGWEQRLKFYRRIYKASLTVCTQMTLRFTALAPGSPPRIQCDFDSIDPATSPLGSQVFGAVLDCTGHGLERTTLSSTHTYQGVPFWGSDRLQLPNFGLHAKQEPRILISGSGDGALQDFLRITTTHQSAKDIAVALSLPAWVRRQVADINDQTQRLYAWGNTSRHDHIAMSMIHRRHLGIVRKLLAIPGFGWKIDGILRDPLPEVLLVHRCTHFDCYYPLNRLLALLIAIRAYRRNAGKIAAFPRRRLILGRCGIRDIVAAHPASASANPPCGDARYCYGKDHEVHFESFDDCRSVAGAPSSSDTFNIILLRHGIQSTTNPPPPLLRHMLPYYIPLA